MPKAFVLINTEIGRENEVLDTLKGMDSVEEAYMVYGLAYDILTIVKADSMNKLKGIVGSNIRLLTKIKSTLTMIVIEDT